MIMYNFSKLDALTDRLIGEEIGTYDLPYMEYNHHYSFHRKLLYAILKLAPEQFAQIRKAVQSKLCDTLKKESFK